MYVFVYTYIYIYLYISISLSLYIYVHIHTYIFIHLPAVGSLGRAESPLGPQRPSCDSRTQTPARKSSADFLLYPFLLRKCYTKRVLQAVKKSSTTIRTHTPAIRVLQPVLGTGMGMNVTAQRLRHAYIYIYIYIYVCTYYCVHTTYCTLYII